MRPRPMLAAAVVLLALLSAVAARPPPEVEVRDAARHEGQDVALSGRAAGVRETATGRFSFDLVSGGWSVRVLSEDPVGNGQPVHATGRLLRLGGVLTLDAHDVRRDPDPQPLRLGDLAASRGWIGQAVEVQGEVAGDVLRDGKTEVRLGRGPWPEAGRVHAIGALRQEPSCLCLVLDAREVRAWTP